MSKNLSVTSDTSSGDPRHSFENATGPIDYGFTNDYMFNTIMQRNEHVLRGLICALLHLKPDDIKTINVKSPILTGKSFKDKEFILDFTPFPEYAEFYATYKLLNIKNQHLYSDKFTLSVVDLTHIELATDEDKAYGIDRWARLFKSTTWEEIKMIAENNPYLTDASEMLYTLNSDEAERRLSQARLEYIIHEKAVNKRLSEDTAAIQALTTEKEAMAAEMQAMDVKMQAMAAKIERLQAQLAEYEKK